MGSKYNSVVAHLPAGVPEAVAKQATHAWQFPDMYVRVCRQVRVCLSNCMLFMGTYVCKCTCGV